MSVKRKQDYQLLARVLSRSRASTSSALPAVLLQDTQHHTTASADLRGAATAALLAALPALAGACPPPQGLELFVVTSIGVPYPYLDAARQALQGAAELQLPGLTWEAVGGADPGE